MQLKSMKVLLKRIYNCSTYCIGHLYIDGTYICDTIEDTDRGLDKLWPLSKIVKTKIKSKTAIPTGIYTLTLNIVSPKFSQIEYYKNFCKGRLPRLLLVPGFDGILMHKGETERSSAGCLIVGYNTVKGRVTNSQKAFEKLYKILRSSKDVIKIEISRTYKV